MKLNVKERYVLLQILPREGDFITITVLKELKEKVFPSVVELDEFEIKQVNSQIKWNDKGDEEREIEIGERATDIIVGSLKKLNDEKKLTEDHFSLYEKFVK